MTPSSSRRSCSTRNCGSSACCSIQRPGVPLRRRVGVSAGAGAAGGRRARPARASRRAEHRGLRAGRHVFGGLTRSGSSTSGRPGQVLACPDPRAVNRVIDLIVFDSRVVVRRRVDVTSAASLNRRSPWPDRSRRAGRAPNGICNGICGRLSRTVVDQSTADAGERAGTPARRSRSRPASSSARNPAVACSARTTTRASSPAMPGGRRGAANVWKTAK
jgi:hypothetical protein